MNNFVVPLLQKHDHMYRDQDLWTSPLHAVIFAIDVLIDTINVDVFEMAERKCLVTHVSLFANSIHKSGRCHSLASRFQPSSSTWHYLILLPRVQRDRDHTSCGLECKHNRVNMDIYQPRHREECTGCCEMVGSPTKTVAEHIKRGGIPLISLSQSPSHPLKVNVLEGIRCFNYTAISHVEPEDLAIPCRIRCQSASSSI